MIHVSVWQKPLQYYNQPPTNKNKWKINKLNFKNEIKIKILHPRLENTQSSQTYQEYLKFGLILSHKTNINKCQRLIQVNVDSTVIKQPLTEDDRLCSHIQKLSNGKNASKLIHLSKKELQFILENIQCWKNKTLLNNTLLMSFRKLEIIQSKHKANRRGSGEENARQLNKKEPYIRDVKKF